MKSIFKVLFLSLCIIANTHLAYAQTASILPQGKTQFLDNNGKPLTSGTVDFYIPSTTTRKTTWQNSGETVANTNPVVLDAGGRAIIYGDGVYRMVVKDRLGNLIYDQLTSSTGSGSTGPTSTGDGDLVGTIKPWAGMQAPNQYLFTYGQEVSRTTYSALFTAITSTQTVFCTSGSPTLTGLGDTSNFWVGMSLEISCVAAGNTTVLSKTASTVTMAVNANTTTNANAVFFPWGRGNGATTFNLPDLRGVVLAGNNIMGGVSSSNLTTTYFGSTDPNSSGALGGNQSHAITLAESASHTHGAFINDPTHNHAAQNQGSAQAGAGVAAGIIAGTGGNTTGFSATGVRVRSASGSVGTLDQVATVGGGIGVSATIDAVGSGYTNGAQTITITGGTCSTQPQFTVTVAGNIFTGTPSLLTAGSCTITPTNPAATSGGGGTGGTLNVIYSAQPVSLVQPTRTTNFIIKVTPDSNSATASGVTSLGSMTGDIACGAGLSCTGNIISVLLAASGTTGAGAVVLQNTPTINTPILSNPTVSTGTFTSPTFITPALGTPASGVATNLTGTAAGLTAGTVTTNANLTGPVTSVGNATSVTNNAITNAMIRQGVARSVIGVTGNATANVADIQGTTNQVLRVDSAGTSLGFGAVNLAAAAAVTGVLATANGGTNTDIGTAWGTYTPSVACGTATFTTTSARFKTMGKITVLELDVTFTALGTCTNLLTFNLPATAQSGGSIVGRENVVSGKTVGCSILASGTTASCTKADATNFANTERLLMSGVYENQ